jgi:hypothetical protein
MTAASKRAIVSAACIGAALILIAIVMRWAGPRFGLNMTAQVVIVAIIIAVLKTIYFTAVSLNDDRPVNPPGQDPDAPPASD